jgi:hypothetical protein
MNSIKISALGQFDPIVADSLCLSGEEAEGMCHNMWCITLEGDLIDNITLEQLKHFVDRLIENREQQVKNINLYKNVLFYMWFDQQALQLRFNVITGDVNSLPFACKVRLYNAPVPILNNFINTVKEVIRCSDRIEFFNDEDCEDDENVEEYILDVFVKKLRVSVET